MSTPTRTRAAREQPRSRILAAVAAAFIAGALALIPAAGASAHDYLVDSTPKANSVQTAPLNKISLTFDDIVLDLAGDGSSSLLQVTGPDGANTHFETGCPTVLGRVVTAPVALGPSGKYIITWQIVSADGHTVSNSLDFTYSPPAGTTEAKGTSSRPQCGRTSSESGAATSTPAAQTSGASNSSSLGIVVTIGAVIIGLAVIGVITVLVTGRRRRPGSRPSPESDDD
ncbi:MAG: copper resistance CopC family protein [Microbacteriaceae bacterium]